MCHEWVVVLDILIPNLGARWKLMVNATLLLRYALEVTPVPIVKVLWTPTVIPDGYGEETILLAPGVRPPHRPARSRSLYRLHYPP